MTTQNVQAPQNSRQLIDTIIKTYWHLIIGSSLVIGGIVASYLIASLLGMLSSGYLGMFLLRVIGVTTAPLWMDIAVTGLAVGAGTKPLHDLISKIEKSK
jgi:hypothetical protein